MRIAVGSKNPAKIEAVSMLLERLDIRARTITSISTASGVSDQPASLAETIQGARNRAQNAFASLEGASLGIGIEGGLSAVPHTHTGYMNICAASIYDGNNFFVGLSSGFEHPAEAIRLVREEQFEIRDAYVTAGLENSDSFSTKGGAIGFMSDQLLSRAEYCFQALLTAYVALNKQELLLK